jgi:multidrug efflux pump subunit AcrB
VFLCLLGLLSLGRLPLQLFPDVNRPQLSVQAGWRTASPEEVESELLEPLEKVMQGMPGVEEIEGNAQAENANVNMRFAIGTDMKNALVEVIIGRIDNPGTEHCVIGASRVFTQPRARAEVRDAKWDAQ